MDHHCCVFLQFSNTGNALEANSMSQIFNFINGNRPQSIGKKGKNILIMTRGYWSSQRECRRQGRHGSIREIIYNEEEDVSLSKHEIYMELLYFWLLSEWLSTPGKITIFLYLLIRASFFPKMARKRPIFCIKWEFFKCHKEICIFMYY